MRGLTRFVVAYGFATAVVLGSCNSPDLPTGPSDSSIRIEPRFAFTGGSGTLLGATTAGELVLIDLDADSISLIGDAGSVGGSEVAWFDIAFDGEGTLIAVTEVGTSCVSGLPCSYLYEIDPETGAIDQDIGSTGEYRIRGIDFAGDSLFGSGYGSDFVGNLFTIDAVGGSASAIPNDTASFGTNPFDTLSRPIAPGGFAVHPTTGDFWGIENEDSKFSVLYRIDRSTGVADSIMPIGVNGMATDVPFIGLHILDDGTFVAVRDLASGPDSAVYEVSSVPDSTSGLAEVAVIPLAVDTTITGPLHGLEAGSPPSQAAFTLSLSADTSELHPWVPFISDINGFQQARRLGDSTALSISATEEVDVTIRAEFLDGSGGHSHIGSPVSFDDIGVAVDRGAFIQMGSILGQPLAGFFAMEGDSAASFDDITVDGQVSLTFTAGTVGGLVDIIVETVVDATAYADTVTITIKVPDLIHADTSDVVNSVYFVGGVPNPVQGGPDVHVQASNWYMPQDVAERVEAIASTYRVAHALDVGGGLKYLQHNDASLKFGGTFSVTGLTGDLGDHPTNHQHYSHQLGLDVDFNWCMVTSVGDDNQANRVYGTTCPDSTDYVDPLLLTRFANAEGACAQVHNGNHFHIRFTGECPDA